MSLQRKEEIVENLTKVKNNMQVILDKQQRQACLVAVSKYKPTEDLMYAYEAGQRHFGENYLPKDIQWHFIGHLQSNKCKTVAVERKDPLRVFVQVNTSEEEAKSGVSPAGTVQVCKHIMEACPNLKLHGLMTIGMFGRDPSEENPDFKCLVECKKQVEKELGVKDLELSMGMSSDYIGALEMGATNVRVGTTIFGGRLLKSELNK
ncbi:YggS family pyridoxal phosphate enzyme [Rhizopus delemar RA 99-880]|uniref:Pyridoxal phosphate homeostasis protein n=1 Tax=Rhizopus delemar (strain RA 99-880 / ATCC MYA-4621 / FGSC 9543 / NRRL 43880) TaxID=246409 RepID=I1BRJ1_RHIO9|nr:YggS family pyridoxal phosphate enzyme [Rhizopus delemar RA 99-880]|eukprot:EIE78821.1 YggS family pyridoxal phosphate enzyme [Rhizopus delemar RA 99-880]